MVNWVLKMSQPIQTISVSTVGDVLQRASEKICLSGNLKSSYIFKHPFIQNCLYLMKRSQGCVYRIRMRALQKQLEGRVGASAEGSAAFTGPPPWLGKQRGDE